MWNSLLKRKTIFYLFYLFSEQAFRVIYGSGDLNLIGLRLLVIFYFTIQSKKLNVKKCTNNKQLNTFKRTARLFITFNCLKIALLEIDLNQSVLTDIITGFLKPITIMAMHF